MSKSTKVLLPIVAAILLAGGIFMGYSLNKPKEVLVQNTEVNSDKFADILTVLDRMYVDSIQKEEIFEEAISDMLHKLDPHSNYIAAKDLQSVTESIEGRFGGVGVRFALIRDTLCITNVVEGSPSEAAGIKAGDKFINVDDEDISGETLNSTKVMELLKGKEGTNVKVIYLRDGKKGRTTITRGSIPMKSISSAYMIDKEIGYIRLTSFTARSDYEFASAARELKEKGMKKLILDLRFNGGGVLGAAVNIADEFLPAGMGIVSTRTKGSTETYPATAYGNLEDTEVAVLINQSSASASEILAGALQDNDRGTIIGRRSFGKGLVQQDFNLTDGSNLRLTVARYYTPLGRSVQKPYSDDYMEYMMDQRDRYENGELYAPDSSVFVDSLKFTTPKGKVVYGGGGIMPDIFVPYDSTGASYYYNLLSYADAFGNFAFDYVADKRESFKSPNDLVQKVKVDDVMLNRFVEYAELNNDVEPSPAELEQSKARIKTSILTEIMRQVFIENGASMVINKTDNEVQEALDILKK